MTDDQTWQAPGGPPRQPTAAPPVAPPVAPPMVPPMVPPVAPPVGGPIGYGPPAPGYGPPYSAPGGQAGWTPPPKPGLIPLRPLDLGTLLGATFRVLRRNPRPVLGVSLLIQLVVGVSTFGLVGAASFLSLARIDNATTEDLGAITAGSFGITIVSAVIAFLVGTVGSAWLQGIVVIEVARAALGEKLTLRKLWRHGKGRFGALVGWSIVMIVAMVIALGIIIGAIVVLVLTLGNAGILFAVLLGFVGFLGLVVLGAWLGTKLLFVPSAIVLERLPIRAALARSWSLTRGSFWRVFGIQLLVLGILWIASSIISAPFSIAQTLVISLIDPTQTNSSSTVAVIVVIAGAVFIVSMVISAITSVMSTATSSLLYLDARMRREGLDLTLTRFVEARQSGTDPLTNPYLPYAQGQPTSPFGVS